jgi:uncharacterized protein (DUF1778 family)
VGPRGEQKRSERLNLRLTPNEVAILQEKARKTQRTVTSIVAQLIDEIDKVIP